MVKFKKSDLAKFTKLNLPKGFVKTNFFETDFLTLGAQKIFIHIKKTFIKALCLDIVI